MIYLKVLIELIFKKQKQLHPNNTLKTINPFNIYKKRFSWTIKGKN